uniref:Protein BCP1 n=1 Tax=Globisporangium ultimum (strain ATCC 200006 / CBS 805.95 / DAOM BR144) TaxID=431595 RepID=K3X197_GLOUD
MPPQKRGRAQKSRAADDHSSGSDAPAEQRAGGAEVEMMEDDSSDDDSDSDDDLTFAEKASDEDDDDEDDEDEDMEDADTKTSAKEGRNVNVEFVFSDPRESHFHSVKQFLIAYLPPTQPFNVSGLADAIVNQVTTGTMVCVEGEDDVYGFITALSLKCHQTENYMQQILQYVTKKCPGDDLQRFQTILNSKSVGLLVNERMVNLPYQLVPAIHSALHEDIEWAIENEETAELRESFKFDYFLILSSCSMEKSGSAGGSGKGKGKKAKTQYEQTAKFFHNFEDEFLEQEAEVVFVFETPKSDRDAVDQTNKTTVVMLIERSKHKAALTSISSMINA